MATVVQLPTDITTDFATRLSNFNTSSERGTLLEASSQSAGTKRKMSFSVTSFGNATAPLSAMKYNGQSTPVRQSQSNAENNVIGPYTAVYSGISVYEMSINDMIVMRRRADSWLNATQILKIAGVDKGKRTKVLEKEILSGEHEKVQGGYGRYQGTWINYKRGRDFCRAYGVEDLLRPLLDYDMGQDGEIPGDGVRMETPTKEQAMAAQRKKMMYNGQDKTSLQTPNTTFFQGISPIAASAINALSKARFDSPGSRPATGIKRSASGRNSSQQENNSYHNSQQSMQSENSFNIDPSLGNGPYFAKPSHSSLADTEPPRKRARPSSGHDVFGHTNGEQSYRERSPTEPNESFMYPQATQADGDDEVVGLSPLPEPTSRADIAKQHILASLFLDPTRENLDDVPGIETLSGTDFDIPIDQGGHTALHWAATLARPSMLKALAARGANIFRVNSGGETALMRAVRTTNNLDQNTFAEILEPLGPTIEIRDDRRQTILHHLATTSAIRGRSSACRYYLDSLLEFVVKQGNVSNNNQQGSHGYEPTRTIGLAKFMSDIVNAQDIAGDTALNLAARINNKSIIQQLLEIGANPSIPNRGGLKPLDFGVGENVVTTNETKDSSQNTLSSSQPNSQNRVGENSRHLLDALKTLITDTELSFRSELQAKQSLIDQEQARLRSLTTALADDQSKLYTLQNKAKARATLRHQIATLKKLNAEKKNYLAATGGPPLNDVAIGDADNGLAIDLSVLGQATSTASRTAEQEAYLDSVPVSYVLQARTRAYQTHNKTLEARQQDLETKSTILERKLRRVVALSTGIEESDIDTKADRLAAAIQSEEGEEMDMTRVREFLRRLEDNE